MSNTPAIIPQAMTNLVMAPPAELMAALSNNFVGMYDNYGSAFRKISLRGNRFTLKDSGNSTIWQQLNLPVVILGMAHDLHCVWYKGAYNPQNEGLEPDAVWWKSQGAPSFVPSNVLSEKVDERNQYQILQRLVVALLRQDPQTGSAYVDLDNPYVLDVGSMSIFDKDMADQMAFSFSGLARFCKAQRVLMLHFVTNLVFDAKHSVPVLKFCPANQQGQLIFLDAGTLERVYQVAAGPEVAELLQIRVTTEARETTEALVQAVTPQPAPVQPAPVQVIPPVPQPESPVDAVPTAEQVNTIAAKAQEFLAPTQPAPEPVTLPGPVVLPDTPAPVGDETMMDSALAALLQQAGHYGN